MTIAALFSLHEWRKSIGMRMLAGRFSFDATNKLTNGELHAVICYFYLMFLKISLQPKESFVSNFNFTILDHIIHNMGKMLLCSFGPVKVSEVAPLSMCDI